MTVALIGGAAVPAIAAAQQPVPDSARQGTATGRAVNRANESGDTTRSALRDSLLRNSTNTSNAREGAASTGQSMTPAPGAPQTVGDSAGALQGNAPGRPVVRTNESGDTTRSALRDEVIRNSTSPGASATSSPSGSAESAGMVRRGGTRRGARLSMAQARQLQEALNSAGCDAGTADGRIGPKTRSAMTCARQKNGISDADDQALYKALGLSF